MYDDSTDRVMERIQDAADEAEQDREETRQPTRVRLTVSATIELDLSLPSDACELLLDSNDIIDSDWDAINEAAREAIEGGTYEITGSEWI